jgi:hypothetical protein
MEDTTLMDTAPQEQVSQEEVTTTDTVVDVWDENFDIDSAAESSSELEDEQTQPETEVDLESLYREQISSEDIKLDKPILIKYKGKVVDVNDVNEIRDMMERAVAATYKLQEAAEIRKQYEGITPEDIELLKRFKQGDTSVVEELAVERPSVDTATNEVDQIASEILQSDYAEQFRESVAVLGPKDKELLSTNPQVLNGLKIDFEKGIAQKVMPVAERLMAVKGLPFLEAYAEAGKQVIERGGAQKVKQEQLSAAPKTGSVNTTPPTDVWSMDTETFKKLSGSIRR